MWRVLLEVLLHCKKRQGWNLTGAEWCFLSQKPVQRQGRDLKSLAPGMQLEVSRREVVGPDCLTLDHPCTRASVLSTLLRLIRSLKVKVRKARLKEVLGQGHTDPVVFHFFQSSSCKPCFVLQIGAIRRIQSCI